MFTFWLEGDEPVVFIAIAESFSDRKNRPFSDSKYEVSRVDVVF